MSDTDLQQDLSAVDEQYRARATQLAVAEERDVPDFDAPFHEENAAVEEDAADEPGEDQGPPTMAWKKDEIVDYLLSADVGVERDELEAMTKAELLENFVDAEA